MGEPQAAGDHTVALTLISADGTAFAALLGDAGPQAEAQSPGGSGPQPGSSYDVLPGVRLVILSHTSRRGWGEPEVVDSALTFAANVSPTAIARWLTDRLSGRRVRLEIDGQAMALDDQASVSGKLAAAAPR